jgi:YozE SAM-like fold
MTAATESFWDWLMRQTNRNSPLGDLARDAKRGRGAECCKPHFTSPDAARTHLAFSHCAYSDAIDAMTNAWRSYLQSRARAARSAASAHPPRE